MRQYLKILENIMENGFDRPNRTGIDTRALFGEVFKHDMRDGFPAVTTKKLAFNVMRAENIWFLTGSRDESYLRRLGAKIWKANAEADYWKDKAEFPGDVGRIYSVQMRKRAVSAATFVKKLEEYWKEILEKNGSKDDLVLPKPSSLTTEGFLNNILNGLKETLKYSEFQIDQVEEVLDRLENKPFSRRQIIDLWEPSELDQMCLPPCHLKYQFHVDGQGGLHLTMYQRSCDMFLGVPFNIAHCALYLAMFAKVLGLEPRTITITLADAHIYHNHFDQVRKQLSRKPKDLPNLYLSDEIDKEFLINLKDNESLTKDDLDELIRLENYEHHTHISAPMAV